MFSLSFKPNYNWLKSVAEDFLTIRYMPECYGYQSALIIEMLR